MSVTRATLMHMQNLIGTAAAASILGRDRSTVVRQVQAGILEPVSKLDSATGAYVFDRAVIEALAAAQ